MDEAQCQFLAQHELVTIVPQFTLDVVALLSGSFGPFRVHYPSAVPMWLALFLRNSKACTVRPPAWLSVENMTAVLEYEKSNDTFAALPHYYMEVASMLLENCSEDFAGISDVLGRLLGEVAMCRWQKVLVGLDVFRSAGVVNSGMRVTNLTCSELRRLRPVMLRVMDDGADLDGMAEPQRRRRGGDATDGSSATGTSWTGPTIDMTTAYADTEVTADTSTAATVPKRRRTLRDV